MKKHTKIAGRIFLPIVLLAIFIALFVTFHGKSEKTVIGILNPNPGLADVVKRFKSELSAYGYVEGKNTTYVYGENQYDFASVAQDFKRKNVDLVLTLTTRATLTAKKIMEETGIPIVFTSYDPVGAGIVKSMRFHEENVTGIKVGGNMQKAFEWLLEIAPDIKKVFVPIKFDTEAASLSLAELKRSAQKNKIDIVMSEVETVSDLKSILSSMPKDVDAVFIVHSVFIVSNLDMIMEAAIDRKLPTGAESGQYENGVTISYGLNHKRTGEQAARLACKILQGASASSQPIEVADFFLGLNMKTAKAIGLEIPHDIIVQADAVVR